MIQAAILAPVSLLLHINELLSCTAYHPRLIIKAMLMTAPSKVAITICKDFQQYPTQEFEKLLKWREFQVKFNHIIWFFLEQVIPLQELAA